MGPAAEHMLLGLQYGNPLDNNSGAPRLIARSGPKRQALVVLVQARPILLPPGRPRLRQDRTIALQPELTGAKIKAIGPRSESEAFPCEEWLEGTRSGQGDGIGGADVGADALRHAQHQIET